MSRCATQSLFVVYATTALAQSPTPLTGSLGVTGDLHGTTFYHLLDLTQQGNKLTGKFGGNKLEGTFDGASIHFSSRDEDNNSSCSGVSGLGHRFWKVNS